jgi:uncharacterized protein
MKTVFADTFYWVALLSPGDDWHGKVLTLSQSLGQTQIITTDEVLTEVLTFYADAGTRMRQRVIVLVESILTNQSVQVVEQTRASFLLGFELYRSRLDKGYSLTDCISMKTMQELGIAEVLTHDQHFAQEGFLILFK